MTIKDFFFFWLRGHALRRKGRWIIQQQVLWQGAKENGSQHKPAHSTDAEVFVFQCPLNRFDRTWGCRNPWGNLRFLFFFGLRNHDSKSMTCLVSRQVQSGDTCLWRTALMTHCGCVRKNHSVDITRGRMYYKRSLFSLKMSCQDFSWSNDCWRRASLRIRSILQSWTVFLVSISVDSPVSVLLVVIKTWSDCWKPTSKTAEVDKKKKWVQACKQLLLKSLAAFFKKSEYDAIFALKMNNKWHRRLFLGKIYFALFLRDLSKFN